VVAWSVAPTGAGPAGIFARRFDALGIPLGPAFRVSRWTGHDVAPSVAADRYGNFVVAWRRGWDDIYARSFSAAGTPLTDEIPVKSSQEWSLAAPSVALTGDGRFAVLWQSPSAGVVGQLFAGDGRRLGGTALISDGEWGSAPVVAWSDQGFFVTAYEWTNRGIAARRLPL
jgi:hypothetical protein